MELWKQRNEDLHGRDYTSRKAAEREKAINAITVLYSKKEEVLPSQRDFYFGIPLDERLKQHTNTIQQYVNNNTAGIYKSAAEAKKRATSHTKPLTHYFTLVSHNR
jgi:hypothetical protein